MPKRNGLKVGLFCVLFSFVFIGLQVPLPRCFQVVRQISALEIRRESTPKSCLFLLKQRWQGRRKIARYPLQHDGGVQILLECLGCGLQEEYSLQPLCASSI